MTLKSTGWTPEKRARAAALTKKQKPWEKSTGPVSSAGKKAVSRNAMKHGFRSEDYKTLCALLRIQARFIKNVMAGL